MYEETTEKLLEFISKSPTAFQAAEETRRRFLEEGFTELKEEERWELEKAMELYKKYDVYVVSDEIWSDITLSGNKHIPTQSVSEDARSRTVALYAPSKTFNLAGLVGSYHIIYNP